MTATGIDRMTVVAGNKADARDLARRRWEQLGLRMVDVLEVREMPGAPVDEPLVSYRVEAVVEVLRR